MAELIPWYIPAKYTPPKFKWLPEELRGKLLEIAKAPVSTGGILQFYHQHQMTSTIPCVPWSL